MNKNEPIFVEAYAVPANSVEVNLSAESTDVLEGPNEVEIDNFLASHSWPSGLKDCLIKNLKKTQMRYFLCDDSGSMACSDGQMIVKGNGTTRMVPCSRWKELAQSIQFHAELAYYGCIPTEFRMLNRGTPVRIGISPNAPKSLLDNFLDSFEESPSGGTPLCHHIRDIVREVRAQEQQLRAAGQMACVVIATDGEATDGDIVEAMRHLKQLPVWIVVRLCTNQSNVVDYWSAIDKQLELNMEVLDDFQGEAQEIYKHNPWLTYGEPLHRLREFGVHIKEVDFLDEQRCQLEQVRILCATVFGGRLEDYPHPEADWAGFKATIERLNVGCEQIYSPMGSGRRRAWVDLSKVKHKKKSACVIC